MIGRITRGRLGETDVPRARSLFKNLGGDVRRYRYASIYYVHLHHTHTPYICVSVFIYVYNVHVCTIYKNALTDTLAREYACPPIAIYNPHGARQCLIEYHCCSRCRRYPVSPLSSSVSRLQFLVANQPAKITL